MICRMASVQIAKTILVVVIAVFLLQACGSGEVELPTPAPSPTATEATATALPVSIPTVSPTSTQVPTPTAAPSRTSTPTPTVSPTSTQVPTPTAAPSQTPTPTPAPSPTPTRTATPTPTSSPTPVPTPFEPSIYDITPSVPFPNPFELHYFPAYHSPAVVGNVLGVEVSTDTGSLNFKFPLDGEMSRTLMLKNTNGTDVLVSFKAAMNMLGFDESAFINHPQGGMLILSPGEIFPIRLNYAIGQTNLTRAGERIDASMNVTITVQKQENTPGESRTFKWNDTLEKISDGPPFRDPEANATIKLKVVDRNGKALSGIDVMVATGSTTLNAQTDQNGTSQISVFAYQRTGTIHWRENTVTLEDRRSGINSSTSRVITPKAGETVYLTVVMKSKTSPQVEYSLVKVLDIGYQAPYWDASDDGKVIATVPFHTGESAEKLVKNAYLNVFNSHGDLLWKHPIGGETPTVDVSTDGSLIATTVQLPPGPGGLHWGGVPTVFDRNGKIVLQFVMPEIRVWGASLNDKIASVVQISDDKRYLAVGTGDGRVFFVDMSSGKALWNAYARGQVRKMAFDGTPQQHLIVDSGDGYLRAYDTSGKLLWKTYVDTWLYDMKISKNYIVTTSKGAMAAIHLLEKATGKTLWSYPVVERGSGIGISPDEKLIWYGTEVGGAVISMRNVVLNLHGMPVLDLESARKQGLGAAFAADSPLIFAKSGTAVDLYDFSGAKLWSQVVIKNGSGFSMNYLIWVSPDASRFAVAMNDRVDGDMYGQVYFYQRK